MSPNSEHAYWVVRCQTPHCDNVFAVRYIGTHKPGKTYFPPSDFKAHTPHLHCDTCRMDYPYGRDQIVFEVLPSSPHPDFVPIF